MGGLDACRLDLAVTLNVHPVVIVLDLVKPLGPGRNLGSLGRNAELKRFKHASKIGIPANFASSQSFLQFPELLVGEQSLEVVCFKGRPVARPPA